MGRENANILQNISKSCIHKKNFKFILREKYFICKK